MPTPTPQGPTFVDVLLPCSIVVWVTGILVALVFIPIPEGNKELFHAFAYIGILGGFLALLHSRYGTSKGSDEKSAVLNDLAVKSVDASAEKVKS